MICVKTGLRQILSSLTIEVDDDVELIGSKSNATGLSWVAVFEF